MGIQCFNFLICCVLWIIEGNFLPNIHFKDINKIKRVLFAGKTFETLGCRPSCMRDPYT
jgi:hypothetical protein